MAANTNGASAEQENISLSLEFRGGLEFLFDNQPKHSIQLPSTYEGKNSDIRHLVRWIVQNMLVDKAREDLFVQDDNVRSGILVLINDEDWELEDGPDYVLKDKDTITFISTLHGG